MSPVTRALLLWAPRLAGIVTAAFVGVFALDAFQGQSLWAGLADFGVHLIPAIVLGAIVALAWRWPWIGSLGFGGLAAGYAASVPHRLDWIAVVGGPLLVTAILFATTGVLQARDRRAHT